MAEKSEIEIEAIALLKLMAGSDLEFRLRLYRADPDLQRNLQGGAVDQSAKRAALRQCLDDLARE